MTAHHLFQGIGGGDLRTFLDASHEAIVIADAAGAIAYANARAERLLGAARGALPGRLLAELFLDARDASRIAECEDVENLEVDLRQADGSPFPGLACATRLNLAGAFWTCCALADRRPTERQRLLQSLAQDINATTDLERLFAVVLERLHGVAPFDCASIVRVHLGNEEEVEFLATAGSTPIGLERGARVRYPVTSLLEQLRRSGFVLQDFRGANEVERRLRESGLRSGLSLPLGAEDEVIGILNMAGRTTGMFTAETAEELRPLAAQIAGALKKQMLLAEWEQRGRTLEKLAAEISRMNAELEARVSERTRELQRAYDELKELDRAKTVFLSTVSHELKTPLVTVTGYLEMALRGQLGPIEPRQRKAFETALRNTHRLDRLIEDVLDLTRLELGKQRIQPAPFDLSRVAEEAAGALAIAAQAKRIEVERHVPAGLWAVGDAQRIGQVLVNLLSNAIKFSEERGRVWIAAALAEEGEVEVTVGDEAIGIPPDEHGRIFERFYQVDGSVTRRYGGAGLGLAIVRSILEAHGSRVRLDSRPGAGARFSFRLPAAPSRPAVAPCAPPPPFPRAAPATRVLVVEDEDEIQEFVKVVLEMEGYEVLQAWSGLEAISAVERERPDVVLLDISMAGISGIDVCREIRHREETRRIPIFMLSARTGEEDRKASFDAGADGFIRKPFTPDELLGAVARAGRT
jgi:PAS domain S-box-containing protein